MRIKLIALATAIAALAVGVTTSNASFRSETSVQVRIAKANAPVTFGKIVIDNTDTETVPRPINRITIKSKVAKFNGKALPQCKSAIPTNAAGNNNATPIVPACPKGSKVGTGKFIANTGTGAAWTPGLAFPPDFAQIDGTINIYNYKTSGGEQAALLIEIQSDIPVRDAHQYVRAGIKGGTITADVPTMADLPPKVTNILSPPGAPRFVALARMENTLKPPRSKKPWFTLRNVKNLDFQVVLER